MDQDIATRIRCLAAELDEAIRDATAAGLGFDWPRAQHVSCTYILPGDCRFDVSKIGIWRTTRL